MKADQARSAELLWGPRFRPRRGPKPGLTLDRIVAAANAVADVQGLAALSMQRIAEELGYTKMSLYRYLPGKAELTALMLDAALGPPPDLANVPGGWRPELHAWATRLRERTHRHPWTLQVAVGPRVMGPNELAWLEAGLVALAGAGLTGPERLDAIVLLTGHVRNIVQQTTAPGATSDTVERDLGAALSAILVQHGDRHPEVRAAFSEASTTTQDNALEFGLERILDGLAALIAQRATRSRQ